MQVGRVSGARKIIFDMPTPIAASAALASGNALLLGLITGFAHGPAVALAAHASPYSPFVSASA